MSGAGKRDFEAFFLDATGFYPYGWQVKIAVEGLPDVLPVPTGFGKTEGAVLAWAWRRHAAGDAEPPHLIYCLPMRTLVRQTVERLRLCFERLRSKGRPSIGVYQLMGGEIEDEWASRPDAPWVLVGTQDQLLSRALNRGYSMNRFEWPIHFGLLNQGCRWVIDEVQLMGPGLWTTAQLDWMRRKRFQSIAPCLTTWMSATVGTGFLATTDRKRDAVDVAPPFDPELDADERAQGRLAARRPVDWIPATAAADQELTAGIARIVDKTHEAGTLSLVVCNTVETARDVFCALSDDRPKILLTSRFRRLDRDRQEAQLLDFEKLRRECNGQPLSGDPGLICVSTQVVEAGVDVSARHLWSELAPWPSVIQRLGRLNRDGRDTSARAWIWEAATEGRGAKERIGPYDAADLDLGKKLVEALRPFSHKRTFSDALDQLEEKHRKQVDEALQLKPTPLPRALDVHGLFSTERDVHGGFTDVSSFVRGIDPDADVTVFWRDWPGDTPPRGEDLDGPSVDLQSEGCPVGFFRLRDALQAHRSSAWSWNDEAERWERVWPNDLRPGMVLMLHREVGGYDVRLGWTGKQNHQLSDVPRPGSGRALRDDERSEAGYWAPLEAHLRDAKLEAERLCDGVGLRRDDKLQRAFRTAVIEAAGLHDLGKAHPKWQGALPSTSVVSGGPWAKCPRVLAVDTSSREKIVCDAVLALRSDAVELPPEPRRRGREHLLRLRWAVGQKVSRVEMGALRKLEGVRWAGHVAFRPELRHEAASALAMWKRYREGTAPYPALAVFLAAAHHGKVRTVLRSTTDAGDDVFGVQINADALEGAAEKWPLDFSVAKDGAEGVWNHDTFVLTGHGWTGLVADLLGPWRADADVDGKVEVGVVPPEEPRRLGPFVLAYLEALVRVADWRASKNPSESIKPEQVGRGR